MDKNDLYEVIIIGGSYAGLSAALSLGRSLRKTLIIDSGTPCNKKAPSAHNFITYDGSSPSLILEKTREQLKKYESICLLNDKVTAVKKTKNSFKIITENEKEFQAVKILFCTGVNDCMPNLTGFEDCWGKSILHCPYCHGYEIKDENTGIMANGDAAFELTKTIQHWAKKLTVFTNGTSTLNPEQTKKLETRNIKIIESEIKEIKHENGYIKKIIFNNNTSKLINALFVTLPFIQQCEIPEKLGCEFTENCFIQIDKHLETSVKGIYAAGDCTSLFRSIANAVMMGNKAGAMINKQLIEDAF